MSLGREGGGGEKERGRGGGQRGREQRDGWGGG